MNDKNIDLLEILFFKKNTIDYSFDKMKEIHDSSILPKKGQKVTGRDIGKGSWLIACYGDFFFLEVSSFFDILVRHFTEKTTESNIYYQNWVEWQFKQNKNDDLILYLKNQLDNWYEDFKKIRNAIAHLSHLYYKIDHIVEIESGRFKTFTMELNNEKIEIVNYCDAIKKKISEIIDFIDRDNYWDKRYDYIIQRKQPKNHEHCCI